MSTKNNNLVLLLFVLVPSAAAWAMAPQRWFGTKSNIISTTTSLNGGGEGQEDGLSDLDATALYPQPTLVSSGTLAVSEIHTIAYFEYGNPDGKPVLFVHGGPGGVSCLNQLYLHGTNYDLSHHKGWINTHTHMPSLIFL